MIKVSLMTRPRPARALGLLAAALLLAGCTGPASTGGSGASTPAATTASATSPSPSGSVDISSASPASASVHPTPQGEGAGGSGTAAGPSSGEPVVLHSTYWRYETASEVLQASSTSVVGRVLGSREEVIDLMAEPGAEPNPEDPAPLVFPFTVYTLEVDAVLKGDVRPGQRIDFSILGGTMDGERYELLHAPVLPTGTDEQYLVSLSGDGTYPGPINLEEGVLAVDGGTVTPLTDTVLPPSELALLERDVAAATAG